MAAKILDFSQVAKAKLKEPVEQVIEMDPKLLGLDPAGLDLGTDEKGRPNTKTALKYRGCTRDEYNEVIVSIKDETDPIVRNDERDIALVMLCLTDPPIPATAAGRKFVENWAPGTLQNLSILIQREGGWRNDYVLKDAKDFLSESSKATPISTPS